MIKLDKLKKITFVLLVLLATGCQANYKITFNDDLSINEEITTDESTQYFDENYKYYSREEAIASIWKNNIEKYKDAGYTYDLNDGSTGAIIKSTYNDFDEYLEKTTIYKQYFEDISYQKSGNIVKIESTGDFYRYSAQDCEKFPVSDLKITITVPYKVIKNNADKTEKNNYIWTIDKNTKDKKIELIFDKSQKKSNSTVKLDFILIFAIIFVIAMIGVYIYYRIKRNDDKL